MNYVKIADKLYMSMLVDNNGNSTAIIRNNPANKGEKIKLQTNFENSTLHSYRSEFFSLNKLSRKDYNLALNELNKEDISKSVAGVKELLSINGVLNKLKDDIEKNITPAQKKRLEQTKEEYTL